MMLRLLLSSLVVVGMCSAMAAAADKTKDDKKSHEAKITKVDAKNGTVTVKMQDKNGKDVEKTFKLAEDIEYMDSTGEVATIDIFTSGDMVLYVEQDGQIHQMKNKDKTAAKKPGSGK